MRPEGEKRDNLGAIERPEQRYVGFTAEGALRIAYALLRARGSALDEVLFYGLDAAGEPVHTESLRLPAGTDPKALARARLEDFHIVEIWQGPLCLVRLRRRAEEQA